MQELIPKLLAGAAISLEIAALTFVFSTLLGAILGLLYALPLKPLALVFQFVGNAIKTDVPPDLSSTGI